MKKVLYILNDGFRKFSYERTAGLYDAIRRADEPINLFIVRSDGYFAFAPGHNHGEYNIFRLPDYTDFDGIFLDINSDFNNVANTDVMEGVLYAVQAAAASGKPVVSMANYIDGFYYVGIDNHAAMTTVIRYLHETMGLDDFWFVMGPEDNYESQVRTQALRDYCAAHGLPCEDERFYAESFIMECGIHGFEMLRQQHAGRLPQAVICANDQIAVGVCQAAEAVGLHVPGDLKVTGFDNLNVSAYLSPSITTLDQMPWTMGDACVDTMLRIWRGEDVPRVVNTPTRLILRESTGHPDPPQADLKRQVTAFIRKDSSVTEFSYKLSAMQYQLPACESIEEICLALTQCVSALKCKGLYMVLDRELYEQGGRFDFRERNSATTDRMFTDGYPDTMELVFAWEAGKPPVFPRQRVGKNLSATRPKGPRENHLFIPLHFMEYTVGYLSIWDCIDIMRIQCASAIVNTLTMALRSYFAGSKLAYVNQMLSGLSMKDDLTGLYNRLGYHNLAPELFKQAKDSGGRLGILFIDMDRLKHMNDTYGHDCGDQAILAISNAIRQGVPREAIPVRYGGDEFLVLTPATNPGEIDAIIDAIQAAIPAQARSLGLTEIPAISAGYVLTDPNTPETLEEYVNRADALMYQDKNARRRRK